MNKLINNFKLGIFIVAGLLFLVILLYMIGKNKQLFGATYMLKARFKNVQGLVAGNNVRYAGIDAGTVKNISIINDSMIEVSMYIQKKMQLIIKQNATASIGTEGFVGNKVVNIIPSNQISEPAQEGNILDTKKSVNTDDMLETLYHTNEDVAVIAGNLKITAERINQSKMLWKILNDENISNEIKQAIHQINITTKISTQIMNDLALNVQKISEGKGMLNTLLNDTIVMTNLQVATQQIKQATTQSDTMLQHLNRIVKQLNYDLNNGNGIIHYLLKDTAIVYQIKSSATNIQNGTDGFNKNMEALKHNFLFRAYFKKLESKNKN